MIKLNLQLFGGRGSSSGGGGGGGTTGGNIKVLSTDSLLSASGKTNEINSVMGAVKKVSDDYGVDLSDLRIAKLDKKDQGVMAYYDASGNLAVNENYFNSKAMNSAYDNSVKSGYHPSRGNKSGLEAVASHELGHALTEEAGRKLGYGDWKLDKVSNDIVKTAKKNLGYKSTSDVRNKISGYGKTSNAERLRRLSLTFTVTETRQARPAKLLLMRLMTF